MLPAPPSFAFIRAELRKQLEGWTSPALVFDPATSSPHPPSSCLFTELQRNLDQLTKDAATAKQEVRSTHPPANLFN